MTRTGVLLPRSGDVTVNPVSGETVRWHLTSADTGGALVRAEFRVGEGGGMRNEHIHTVSEERFEVLAGRMVACVDGRERIVEAGERVALAPGVPHCWWNAGEGDLHFMLEVDPPGRFEETVVTLAALARAGHVGADGMPGLLTLAALARPWLDDAYLTTPPRFVQRAVFAVLDPIARLRGLPDLTTA